MTKLVGTFFKLINIFFVLLYLSTCLIPILPAGKFWMIAVLGLVFPILFVIMCIFFIGWLMVRSGWCTLSLAAILVSWQQISVVAGLNMGKTYRYSKPKETLRLFSWNVSSWGESSKNFNKKLEFRPLMFDLIKKQQADVLCFQEFWDLKAPDAKDSSMAVFREMGYRYSHFVKSDLENEINNIGVAILSKYPITDTASFYYGKDHNAEKLIYADILFQQQTIRIFTTHLESVRFENEEYSTLHKIKSRDEPGIKESKTIIRKLRNAYHFRGIQADFVQQKINESPYPVIISGDFNDVPNSYTYFTIKGNLQDAFIKKGSRIGRTFQYLSPTLRIDYILAAKNFDINQFARIRCPYSDHFPIVTDLTLSN